MIDFDSLWDYSDPAGTEQKFRAALPAIGPDPGRRAELLTQIARAQGLQRLFTKAHATLDDAQALLPQTAARPRLRYLLERGRVFNSSGRPDQARPLFREAWEAGQAAGEDALAVDAAHMLAMVAPPAEQMDWNRKALALAERSADPEARRWLGSLYNNIGWTHHAGGEYEQALAVFIQAEQWREAQGQAREARIARWCVARALRSLGRPDEALSRQQALRAELEAAGETDGYVDEELGECLLALGQADAARPHFARAHAALSQDPWLAEREPGRLERLRRLGQP